jgi:transposase
MDTYRFNHNVDRKVKTEAARVQRVEVITGVERRREWTDEKKLALIAESCRDGVVISDVARRHGLRPQQLFNWRNEFRKRNANGLQCGLPPAAGGDVGEPAFAPVMITTDCSGSAPVETSATAASSTVIEIMLGGVTVRVHSGVDSKVLAAVLRAVKTVT